MGGSAVLRGAALASLLFVAGACSGSVRAGGDAGPSNLPLAPPSVDQGDGAAADAPPAPDALVAATFLAGSDGPACAAAGSPGFTLGVADSHPESIQSGSTLSGSAVQVQCSVKDDGSGFGVELSAQLGGTGSGAGSWSLATTSGTVTASGGQALSLDMVWNDAHWSATGCSLTYRYLGQPVPASPAIAPGRIWAHASCPIMTNQSGATVMVNGMTQIETCDGEMDFLFENCSE